MPRLLSPSSPFRNSTSVLKMLSTRTPDLSAANVAGAPLNVPASSPRSSAAYPFSDDTLVDRPRLRCR